MISKQIAPLLIALLLSSYQLEQSPNPVAIISVSDFEEAIKEKNVQLIDVRTPQEYAEGYIGTAVNFPIAKRKEFKKSLNSLDKEKPIYVYCYSGVRSNRARKILQRLGFQKIYDFKGGWKAWTNR